MHLASQTQFRKFSRNPHKVSKSQHRKSSHDSDKRDRVTITWILTLLHFNFGALFFAPNDKQWSGWHVAQVIMCNAGGRYEMFGGRLAPRLQQYRGFDEMRLIFPHCFHWSELQSFSSSSWKMFTFSNISYFAKICSQCGRLQKRKKERKQILCLANSLCGKTLTSGKMCQTKKNNGCGACSTYLAL